MSHPPFKEATLLIFVFTQTSNSSGVQACSLFYEEVANRLRFPGTDPEYDQGNCSDALTSACVNDLRKQSQDELTNILRNPERGGDSSNNQSSCDRLVDALRDHAPASCFIATNGTWGNIQTRPLTNLTAVPQSDCHPTTGADYNLFQVEANRINGTGQSTKEAQSVLFGVTPIMTVAYRDEGSVIDFDLTCLKTVGFRVAKVSDKEGGASVLGFSGVAIISLRAPPVSRPGRPKPDPDSPTVRPGQTPSRPGDSEDAPAHIGADTTPLNFGASKPGDPGFTPIGDSKDPADLRKKAQKVEEKAYKKSDEYDGAALQKKFDDNYRTETLEERGELSDFLDSDLEAPFKDLGIDDMESLRYRETEVFSKDNNGYPIAQTKYFPEDGFIVGESRLSKNDQNPKEQQLRPSDLIFNQWKSSFGENDGRANTLRAFVGRYVQSKSTVETMQKAQRDTRVALYDKATFKRAADTPEEKAAFDLMEGTDFISSIGFMLKDYAPVLGKKQISSIVCYPRTYDGNDGEENITIVVNFEDVE
ncbi:MAG: hypothetical protein Q9166_002515 [cf. Caloplaca sp. 2 TL-2023]